MAPKKLPLFIFINDVQLEFVLATVLAIIAVLVTLFPQPKQDLPVRETLLGRNNTALFISNSEHGQLNVFLATAQALLLHHPDIEIHFATFAKRAKDIASINEYASLQLPTARSITYHEIRSAPSFADVMLSKNFTIDRTINPPGYKGSTQLCKDIQTYLMPWSGPEHIALFEELSQLIQKVDPSIVAVDTLFGPAMDATRSQNRRHAILSPNALVNNFGEMQPYASILWKYPAVGSSYSYPVPWHLIPANIYINLRFAYSVYFNPVMASTRAYLKEKGITNPVDIFTVYRPDDLTWISQGSLEADFPMSVIPDNVKACGPIILGTASAAEQDGELASWLARAPTVMINLGSHVDYNEQSAMEMAGAIQVLLQQTDVQVIWKFNKRRGMDGKAVHDFSMDFLDDVSEHIAAGRLRIEKWLSIDPPAMLETGYIAAAVHHGGASSFYEAMINGVPQVVLTIVDRSL